MKMKQSSIKLSGSERKVLIALLSDGSKTDTQIAEEIKISKASAGRIKRKLEKEKLITEYIPIVDLEKLGIDMFLIFLFRWAQFKNKQLTQKLFSEFVKDPHVVFFGNGDGSEGLTSCLFLGFRNLDEYHEYFKKFREKYEGYLEKQVSLLVPSHEVQKHDFTDLAKNILQKMEAVK